MRKFRRLSATVAAGSITAALTTALLTTAPAHADGAAACTDTSAKGGVISPCMMIARANSWIAAAVPYNQGGWYTNSYGTYREDCAGFVAMAWHLTSSPPVTYAPPGLDDPSISRSLGTVSSLRSAGTLDTIQPGDALVLTGEHVVLFAGWTDSTHKSAVIDSESHTGVPTSQARSWSTQYLVDEGYKVYRYNNNQANNPTNPPTTTVDTAGVTTSAVTLTGTASPAADYFYFHIQQNGVDKLYSPSVPGTPGTPHHTWSFDPKSLPSGTYQVIASASLNGQIGTSADYNITINNGPVAPSAPTVAAPTGPLSDTVALTASAPGASSVTFKLDGNVIGTSTSGPDFSFEWDTTHVTPGAHSITTVASNSGGSSPGSGGLNVDVENSGRGVAGAITPVASNPSVTTAGDASGKMNVFTRGANGHLYDSYAPPGGAWNLYDITQYASGPTIVGMPTAVLDSSKVLHVFSRGADGHLYDSYVTADGVWNESDLSVNSAAPTIVSDPTVVVDTSGMMHVFTHGINGHLYDTYAQAGGLWNDSDLTVNSGAPTITGSPAATMDTAGNIDVFTRGVNGHLYSTHAPTGGLWNDSDLTVNSGAPTITDSPSVTVDTAGNMNVFTRGVNGHLYDTYAHAGGLWNDSDLSVNSGAPTITGAPAATMDTAGNINVFTRGVNGHLYSTYAPTGGLWNDSDLSVNSGAPTITDAPTVTVDTSGMMNVYTRGTDGHLYDTYAHAGGLWNDYDLTAHGAGPTI